MKHYKSVELLPIFKISSFPTHTQSPRIENFLATVVSLLLIFCPQEAQFYPNETSV